MEKVQNFYQLDAWKKGHTLVLEIYVLTRKFPKEELYGITSQVRRVASSVTANIAEGFGRFHYNDKIRFYHLARGSVGEVQNFLFLARDLHFIEHEECDGLKEKLDDIRRLINGLIRSIEACK